MTTYKQPTPEACTAKETRKHGDEIELACWHPQWGGYASRAVVRFGAQSHFGCFDVANFHDGQFPGDKPTIYHYCNPLQLIEFGLTIAEAQAAHGATDDERESTYLRSVAQRLLKLAGA